MISVDPGESCFWARWLDRQLVACGPWPCLDIDRGEGAVIEDQVIYRRSPNPAAIITLAHRAGAVAAAFDWPQYLGNVRWVKPQSWKGSTKKPAHAADWASYVIHRKVALSLSSPERDIYMTTLGALPEGKRHDLADAVGLGLWVLGRL